jgi:hypothetical protein
LCSQTPPTGYETFQLVSYALIAYNLGETPTKSNPSFS